MSIKDVSVGAWVLLSVIVVSLAAIVIFAPPTMRDALGKADWPHVAGVIGLVGSALVGVFVEWRKATVKAGPLVLLLAASLTAGMASGCGSAAQQHHALNAVANVANPSYDLAITACFEAEDVIYAREGTTFAQDVAATEAVRGVCDRVFAGFDALRVAHRLARSAVDGGGEALVASALAELQEAWTALQRLLPEVERLVA